MKKNLRIVSAAAAALLAVAPVAATAIATPATTVSAATDTSLIDAGHQGLFANKITLAKNADLGNNSVSQFIQGQLGNSVVKADNTKAAADGKSATFNIKGEAGKDVPAALVKAGYNAKFNAQGYVTAGSDTTTPAIFTVNAEAAKPADTSSENIVPGNDHIFNSVFEKDPNTAVNISATASQIGTGAQINWYSTLNGQIVYTDAKGTSHTALLHGDNNTIVTYVNKDGKTVKADHLEPNVLYTANFNKVTINLGNAAAGSKVKFVLPRTAAFKDSDKGYYNVKTVTVDSNGIADLGTVYARFYAYDPTDLQEVHFYSEKTGNQVTSGNITLHAVNGKLSLYSFFHAMNMEYKAAQLDGGQSATYSSRGMLPVAVQNDLRDQLKKQNITVDDNGYFTAPASFTVNMNAKSIYNGATASLPVTVTVDNVTPTAAQETTKTVTIMHISTIYDKNGKATHEPALRAYNSVSVVSDPVSLKDEKGNDAGKFYKLAGKDQYIKVGNVDGTSRSLKHNSYVYKSTGKRNGKKVLKKGSSVTTYGKSFMIAGHQMYRIGKNQYVKKANF